MRFLAALTHYFTWWQIPLSICLGAGLLYVGGLVAGIVLLTVHLRRRRDGDG